MLKALGSERPRFARQFIKRFRLAVFLLTPISIQFRLLNSVFLLQKVQAVEHALTDSGGLA